LLYITFFGEKWVTFSVFSPLSDLPNHVGIFVFVTTIFGGRSVLSPFWAIVFLNLSFRVILPSNFIIHLLAINNPRKNLGVECGTLFAQS
jgi:hypothetical protein